MYSLKDEDEGVRRAAVKAIYMIGGPKAVEALKEALRYSGLRVREEAAVSRNSGTHIRNT